MSVLYLHFANSDRAARVQKLSRSGAHIVVSEPRWPGFFEIAKKEKPYAIAIDFSSAPSHALETADYLSKAKETKEVSFFLLRVPADRKDIVTKRLPKAPIVSEQELAERLVVAEREAQTRAREKKEAAAQARKTARARVSAAGKAAAPTPVPPRPKAASRPGKPAVSGKKKAGARISKKPAPARGKGGAKKSRSLSKKS